MRTFSVSVFVSLFVKVVASIVVTSVLSGCPSNSLLGEPCPEPGAELCEGPSKIRCDGQVFVESAPCHFDCLDRATTVAHEQEFIDNDTTWTCLEGAHVVTGTVNVAAGATLTIEPGSSVRIDPSSRIDVDPAGRIVVDAPPAAAVVITSNNGQAGGFGSTASGGLNVFATDGEPSVLRHLIIERGIQGLGISGLSPTKTPPIVEDCTFRDNTNFGIKIACEGAPPFAIPDFEGDGNQFFENGEGAVSACE